MEDLLDLDLDLGECGWRFWDGLEEEHSYLEGVLPLDTDLGICAMSEDTFGKSML